MYKYHQISIEDLLQQIGLKLSAYETRLRNERTDESSKINFVYIHASGHNNKHLCTSVIHSFDEDMKNAQFKTSYNIDINSKFNQYPFGLSVVQDNENFIQRFHKIEDYLKILNVLSKGILKTGMIEIIGDIDFTGDKPTISNSAHLIKPVMFEFAIADNIHNLSPMSYIEQKLTENNMFYDRSKMNDILKVFEMLVI